MVMFEVNQQQQDAFKSASGVDIWIYDHLILIIIGILALIWLLLIFIGTFGDRDKSVFDAMYEFSFAVFVLIAVGVLIHFF